MGCTGRLGSTAARRRPPTTWPSGHLGRVGPRIGAAVIAAVHFGEPPARWLRDGGQDRDAGHWFRRGGNARTGRVVDTDEPELRIRGEEPALLTGHGRFSPGDG